MSVTDVHEWRVALHHRTSRGEVARKTESVGAWLRHNARCVAEGIASDWIAIGLAPTQAEARALLDRFQADLSG